MSAFRRKIAYDRIVTRFSPEGRLFQVEYALETVKRGATIMGLVCSEGIVLGAEETLEGGLQDPRLSWKIYEVDEHVGAAIVGLGPDARVLIDRARTYAQSNRLMYDEPIDVEVLAKRIGDMKQLCTQRMGIRPFGVSLIIGGVDKTATKVFKTSPSGSCRSYNAVAEGIGRETVEAVLREEYKSDLESDDAAKLVAKCLIKDLERREGKARIRMAVIPAESKTFTGLSDLEVDKYKEAAEKTGINR